MSINVTDKEKAIEIVKKFNKENRYRDCGRINNAIDTLIYIAENSIPKQVVKDKIEEIIKETTPTPVFKPKSEWQFWDYERLYKTQPLLELLEGGK